LHVCLNDTVSKKKKSLVCTIARASLDSWRRYTYMYIYAYMYIYVEREGGMQGEREGGASLDSLRRCI